MKKHGRKQRHPCKLLSIRFCALSVSYFSNWCSFASFFVRLSAALQIVLSTTFSSYLCPSSTSHYFVLFVSLRTLHSSHYSSLISCPQLAFDFYVRRLQFYERFSLYWEWHCEGSKVVGEVWAVWVGREGRERHVGGGVHGVWKTMRGVMK